MDIHERTFVWKLSYCCADLCLLLWTRQDRERFYVSSATKVIKISMVHSPVVKAADCRSAGPRFNSGRRTWFTFMMWYDKLTNPDLMMISFMSPITTSIRTITRKSVNTYAPTHRHTHIPKRPRALARTLTTHSTARGPVDHRYRRPEDH